MLGRRANPPRLSAALRTHRHRAQSCESSFGPPPLVESSLRNTSVLPEGIARRLVLAVAAVGKKSRRQRAGNGGGLEAEGCGPGPREGARTLSELSPKEWIGAYGSHLMEAGSAPDFPAPEAGAGDAAEKKQIAALNTAGYDWICAHPVPRVGPGSGRHCSPRHMPLDLRNRGSTEQQLTWNARPAISARPSPQELSVLMLDPKRPDGLFQVGVEILKLSYKSPENMQTAERATNCIAHAKAYAERGAGGDNVVPVPPPPPKVTERVLCIHALALAVLASGVGVLTELEGPATAAGPASASPPVPFGEWLSGRGGQVFETTAEASVTAALKERHAIDEEEERGAARGDATSDAVAREAREAEAARVAAMAVCAGCGRLAAEGEPRFTRECPFCKQGQALGAARHFFCGKPCFTASWKAHKALHIYTPRHVSFSDGTGRVSFGAMTDASWEAMQQSGDVRSRVKAEEDGIRDMKAKSASWAAEPSGNDDSWKTKLMMTEDRRTAAALDQHLHAVGPGRNYLPRHEMPCNSRNEV